MRTAANLAIGIVAFIHIYVLILEMFLWESATGRRTFGTTREFAAATRVLAANQGLYNGFLAAGLVWGLGSGNDDVQQFFLACVLVAGVYGALTANARILWVQAMPALIALLLVGLV